MTPSISADPKDTPAVSVVLIASGSVKDIKKAHPSYFDTHEFVGHFKLMMDEENEYVPDFRIPSGRGRRAVPAFS